MLLVLGFDTFILNHRTFSLSTRRAIRLLRFCLACTNSARLSGNRFEVYSSSSAFYVCCWAVFYDGEGDVSRGKCIFVNQTWKGHFPSLVDMFRIVILLFGVGRIGKIAGELGFGIRAFKEGLRGNKVDNQ